MQNQDVKTEITGIVWKIEASIGDELVEDDVIMILESMKMEIPVMAPCDGKLTEIHVAEGDQVIEDQTVAILISK